MQNAKIGINGVGRIGRMTLRAAIQQGMLESIKAINITIQDIDYIAYLIKYDSTHGRLTNDVHAEGNEIVIDGHHIKCYSERQPEKLQWDDGTVNIVLECTGAFTTIEKAKQHLHGSVKKVVISAPSADAPMFVYGVNHDKYTNDMDIISNASCTTNCLAPICKVLNEQFGIKRGLMTTVHSVTATQFVQDSIGKKDRRNGRSCMTNIVPASTGAAKAVGKVIPELNGKVTGMAFRVPTIDVSVVDLTVELNKETTYDEICKAMKKYAEGELKGILCYTEDEVVSSDFLGTTQTSTFDAKAGIMLDSTFVKIISWYDNEVGYSNKLLELAKLVASKL